MKLELIINDDKELRAFVRDLIRAEVLAMTRDELRAVIAAEIDRKVKDVAGQGVKDLVATAVRHECLGLIDPSTIRGLLAEAVRDAAAQAGIPYR